MPTWHLLAYNVLYEEKAMKTAKELVDAVLWNLDVCEKACVKVPAGTILINVNGSSEISAKCENCGSWIKHWEKLSDKTSPEAGDCAVVGCNGKTEKGRKADIEGCHVRIKDPDENRTFIAPLCECCNHKAKNSELTLKRETVLVWANVSATCAKLRSYD